MSHRSKLTVCVVALLLAGCSLLRPSFDYTDDYPKPQSFEAVSSSVRLLHRLTMEVGSRSVSFRTVFDITPERATFVLLSPLGTRALSVTQTERQLRVEQFTDRELPIDPRRLYVDLQLLVWPELRLTDPYSLRTIRQTDTYHVRMLMRSGEKFSRLKVPLSPDSGDERVLKQLTAPYTLRLELLSREEGSDQGTT